MTSPRGFALSCGIYAATVLGLALTEGAHAATAVLVLGGGALGVAHVALSRRPSA